MKRFNSINIKNEFQELINYIFDKALLAKYSGFGGFRQKSFENINSNFFSFVFLCGGNEHEYESREVLSDILHKDDNIKIIISENLEQYKGKLDLLTFEALLEAISKMILIPVESYGTACELGAFTRIDKETNKVVAIVNEKYKKEKSFINYGPIQLLKELDDNRVYTASFRTIGGKTVLQINTGIANVYKHRLIKDDIKIKKYFSLKTADDNSVVTDLPSFIIAIIDLICLTGVVNIDFIMDFFSRLFVDNKFYLHSTIISIEHDKIPEIIQTLLLILKSIGFLFEKDGLFFVKPESLAVDGVSSKDRWIGRVLFTNTFTRTDEYLSIKAKCAALVEGIKRYGIN